MHHAARFGHSRAVRLLIRQGAAPYIRNSEGKTPRHLARQLRHVVVDDMLGGLSASKQRRRAKALNRRQKSARKENSGITKKNSISSASRSRGSSTSLSQPSNQITDEMIRCVLDSNC